jgi:hypothetical protein
MAFFLLQAGHKAVSGVRIPWLLLGESVLEFDGSLQELGGREPAQIGGDFIGAVLELVFKPPPSCVEE